MNINLLLKDQSRKESARPYFEQLARDYCIEHANRTSLVMDCDNVGVLTCTWDGNEFNFIWTEDSRVINYREVK